MRVLKNVLVLSGFLSLSSVLFAQNSVDEISEDHSQISLHKRDKSLYSSVRLQEKLNSVWQELKTFKGYVNTYDSENLSSSEYHDMKSSIKRFERKKEKLLKHIDYENERIRKHYEIDLKNEKKVTKRSFAIRSFPAIDDSCWAGEAMDKVAPCKLKTPKEWLIATLMSGALVPAGVAATGIVGGGAQAIAWTLSLPLRPTLSKKSTKVKKAGHFNKVAWTNYINDAEASLIGIAKVHKIDFAGGNFADPCMDDCDMKYGKVM